MGYGSYSAEAHEAITSARTATAVQDVFKQKNCHPLMNPKGIRVRECRDSVEHPNSLGIAFALDVTGSMGAIPDQLARKELPNFMKALQACGVADPQVMFVAVGDATSDSAPLQVGQFETTAELMDQWLTWSFLEGGGGAWGRESYELALYLLAEHTSMDCWEKRHKRGYAFLTGDELPYPALSRHVVEHVLGDRLDEDVPLNALVAAVQTSFEPFFLIPDLGRRANCEKDWRELLGDHVIAMEAPEDTCWVAAGAVAIGEGLVKDLDHLAAVLRTAGAPEARIGAIIRALTPFSASRGRDGAPPPAPATAPAGGWWKRITGG